MATTAKTTETKKKAPAKTASKTTPTKKAATPKKAAASKKEAVPKKASSAKPATAGTAKPKVAVAKAAAKRHVGSDKRRHYIEVAAYYIAERRGFIGGNAADDWKAAEQEIDRLLAEGRLNGG
jgi:surface antigen